MDNLINLEYNVIETDNESYDIDKSCRKQILLFNT